MKKVLLIDSGSGGVNVLLQCVKICPYCDYLLFCDNANAPYGNKTKNELLKLTLNNLKQISTFFDFDIVIFACNTLTSMVMEECKREFSGKIFIGTEPAVNDALAEFDKKDVIVLATKGTIENSPVLKGCDIRKIAMHNLAKKIDDNLDNLEMVKEDLSVLKGENAKAVVLGCTHYVAVSDAISKAFGGAVVYSGEKAVAEHLKRLLGESLVNCKVQIKTSKNDDFLPKLLNYYNKKSRD